MKTLSIRIIIIFSLYLSVSACGNKGDLYIPEKPDSKELSNKES